MNIEFRKPSLAYSGLCLISALIMQVSLIVTVYWYGWDNALYFQAAIPWAVNVFLMDMIRYCFCIEQTIKEGSMSKKMSEIVLIGGFIEEIVIRVFPMFFFRSEVAFVLTLTIIAHEAISEMIGSTIRAAILRQQEEANMIPKFLLGTFAHRTVVSAMHIVAYGINMVPFVGFIVAPIFHASFNYKASAIGKRVFDVVAGEGLLVKCDDIMREVVQTTSCNNTTAQ